MMIFQKDETQFFCADINFTHEELEKLKLLGPGMDNIAGVYMFHCVGEGLKGQLSTKEIVNGNLCQSYTFSSGIYS